MILLLYGEDTFRSRQKLNQIKDKFKKSDPSGMNLTVLDGKKASFEGIKKDVSTAPFIGKNRLVIVENILSANRGENLQKALLSFIEDKKIPDSTVLIFFEGGEPDKRKKLFKELNKPKKSEKFDLLEGSQLNSWIEKRVKELSGKIDRDAVIKLSAFVGSDLWQMDNEISKLLAYGDGKIISDNVEKLVRARLDTNIFNFTDAIGKKDKKTALKLLHDQLDSGAHQLYLLKMMTFQFRNLLIVKDLSAQNSNQYAIAKEGEMHPFVVQKTLPQVRQFEMEKLKQIYQELLNLEIAFKTSKADPVVLLDKFVVEVCR